MQETITIQDAQAHLPDLIARLIPGAEMVITQNDKPVAKIISQVSQPLNNRQPGSAKGKLIIHAEDDDHLTAFQQ